MVEKRASWPPAFSQRGEGVVAPEKRGAGDCANGRVLSPQISAARRWMDDQDAEEAFVLRCLIEAVEGRDECTFKLGCGDKMLVYYYL